jgi:hypothetical protein
MFSRVRATGPFELDRSRRAAPQEPIGLALRYRMGIGTLVRLLRGHSATIRHQHRR